MEVHSYNSALQSTGTGGLPQVQDRPGLQSETLAEEEGRRGEGRGGEGKTTKHCH